MFIIEIEMSAIKKLILILINVNKGVYKIFKEKKFLARIQTNDILISSMHFDHQTTWFPLYDMQH